MNHQTHLGASDSDDESDRFSICRALLMLVNVANHAMILGTATYILYLSWGNLSKTDIGVPDLHILLCTIGYVLLMSEAIAVFAGENVLTFMLTRRSKSHLHWILQVTGAISSVAGVVVIYTIKSNTWKTPHFQSVHAITGITSVVGMVLVFLSGLPALFAARLRKTIRPVYGRFLHNLLGTMCFLIGMVAQIYGYQKGWLSKKSESMVLVMSITTALITIITLLGALKQLKEQFVGTIKNISR